MDKIHTLYIAGRVQTYYLGESPMYNIWPKTMFNETWHNFIITNILSDEYWEKTCYAQNPENLSKLSFIFHIETEKVIGNTGLSFKKQS